MHPETNKMNKTNCNSSLNQKQPTIVRKDDTILYLVNFTENYIKLKAERIPELFCGLPKAKQEYQNIIGMLFPAYKETGIFHTHPSTNAII